MADQLPSQIGRYRILGTAGRSHWGWLYRAHDRILDRDVLITALSRTEADPESRQRFLREARSLCLLAHPNIIQIKDLGEDEGMPFMVFEGLEGKSLLERSNAAMTVKSSLPLILQVLDGLAAMHESIIHCDIKPAHIFVSNDGCAKITDFWLAKLVRLRHYQTHYQTPATFYARFAPPSYMSPELA